METSDLERFITFATGAAILPVRHIVVKVVESDGIFASTCLREISLPKNANNYSKLCELINAVFQPSSSCKSFTAV